MVKAPRETSYTAKQEAKVKYPKFKKEKGEQGREEEGDRNGRKEVGRNGGQESTSKPSGPAPPRLHRTFSKLSMVQSSGEPSRELLTDIILNNSVFDSVENRRQLEQILIQFIAGKT